MLPKLSNAKVEGGIFTAPQIREMVVPNEKKSALGQVFGKYSFPTYNLVL
jgi:hypothetical protein